MQRRRRVKHRHDGDAVHHLGLAPYEPTWALQRRLAQAVADGAEPETLLLLEHPHVYTLGRAARDEHLLADAARLRELGATVVRTDRGGDVTYHGPGQLVGYPLLDLRRRGRDVPGYVRRLEEAIIQTLAGYGIAAGREPGLPGVWVGGAKIAAIGVKVTPHFVTMHGLALNVTTDLSYFGYIVPCGLHDRAVTSLERLLGRPVPLAEVADRFVARFCALFDLAPRLPARA